MATKSPRGMAPESSISGKDKNELIKALLFSAVCLREDAVAADLKFVAYLADMTALELQNEVQKRGLVTAELEEAVAAVARPGAGPRTKLPGS